MAGPYDFTGQNIENTYQRVLQTPDGINFYDGTGSAVTFTATAAAGGSNTQIQFNSASLLSGSGNLSFDYTTNNILLTGSILMSGSSYISGVDYIDFDTTASNVGAVGRLKWNDNDGTLDLGLKGGNVTLQIGQEEVVRVVNKSGTNLTEAGYQVVRISGAQGGRVKVALAKGDGDPNSLDTLGLATEDIADNQEGYITTAGLVRKIDTRGVLQGETWAEGDALYLSPTIFGGVTNIPPTAPSHSVRLGYVVQASPNGSIYVKVDNGYELDELHNVYINTSSLAYGDLLMRDGNNVWINTKTLSGSYTLSGSLTTNDGVKVQSLTASFVSASSITGSLFGTSSWAQSSSVAISSSYALSSSFSISSSFATSASFALSSSRATTSSFALTASYTPNALVTASISSNTITFTKGNGSTFPITINTGSIGPGQITSLALWNSTSTITSSSLYYLTNNDATTQAVVSKSLFNVISDGIKIQSPPNTLPSSSNSNIFVNNISPAGNFIEVPGNNYKVIKYLDLYQYNINDKGGCFGLILDFNLMIGPDSIGNFRDQNAYIYNKDIWPNFTYPNYVETGRIYFSWLGADPEKGGAVGRSGNVTYLTMNPTIINAAAAGWEVVDSGTPSATSLAASEEGVVAPYGAPIYRDQNVGYQFGYKLVNNPERNEWYVEVALYNDTDNPIRITHTTKILNLFTNP